MKGVGILFAGLIGYNTACFSLGKKDQVDRKGKAEVAGKRRETECRKEGLDSESRRRSPWREGHCLWPPHEPLAQVPSVALWGRGGHSHWVCSLAILCLCSPWGDSVYWGQICPFTVLNNRRHDPNSKEHLETFEAQKRTRHVWHSAKCESSWLSFHLFHLNSFSVLSPHFRALASPTDRRNPCDLGRRLRRCCRSQRATTRHTSVPWLSFSETLAWVFISECGQPALGGQPVLGGTQFNQNNSHKDTVTDAIPRIFAIEKRPLKLNESLEKY